VHATEDPRPHLVRPEQGRRGKETKGGRRRGLCWTTRETGCRGVCCARFLSFFLASAYAPIITAQLSTQLTPTYTNFTHFTLPERQGTPSNGARLLLAGPKPSQSWRKRQRLAMGTYKTSQGHFGHRATSSPQGPSSCWYKSSARTGKLPKRSETGRAPTLALHADAWTATCASSPAARITVTAAQTALGRAEAYSR
jgi:hypothetical protein